MTQKKQRPQRVTTPAPELPNEQPEEEQAEPVREAEQHALPDGRAIVDVLERLAIAAERLTYETARRADMQQAALRMKIAEHEDKIADEQQQQIDRANAGRLQGSTIDPLTAD